MDRFEGSSTALAIDLHRGLYLAFIMDRYKGPRIALSIALHALLSAKQAKAVQHCCVSKETPQQCCTIALL
jgi:hypothetical protein